MIMRVAITGGAGFIGMHVVDRLVDAGYEVISLDVRSGHPDPRVAAHAVDVLDLDGLTEALSGCAAVFHLAGMSNVDVAYADPARTVALNVLGVGNVCEAARRAGVGRVLFASTVWVYGAMSDGVAPVSGPPPDGESPGGAVAEPTPAAPEPLTEDAPVVLARAGHVYTSTKIAGELVLHSYHQTYGLPFTILRYGIPYGPGMRGELVLAQFVRKAANGEPLTVAGDGQQFRNYVYVGDLAHAHVLAMADAAANTTIALEGDERVSVLHMARTVCDFFPGTTIEHMPARPGDFRGRPVSNALAGRLLGWRPTTPFREGVRQYIDWYRANNAPSALTDVSIGIGHDRASRPAQAGESVKSGDGGFSDAGFGSGPEEHA
jgi:UDP-glucose 4-epimerase